MIITSLLAGRARAEITVEQAADKTVWNVTIGGVDFLPVDIDGTAFLQAKLRGVKGYEGVLHEEGRPELPVIRFWVDGDGDIQVEPDPDPVAGAWKPTGGRAWIKPAIPSVPKVAGAKPFLTIDLKFYSTPGTGEKPAFEVSEVGTIRGQRRRLVTLYPFKYDPVKKAGSLTPRFRVTLRVKPAATNGEDPLKETLALVVADKFEKSPSLAKYRALKQSLGYSVEILSIAAADAKPETIRARLRDLYESSNHALKHAVLVGTHADLPAYSSSRLSGVTDHYFRSLDADDYEKDVGTPDIGVGRLSVQNEEQLAVVVDKLVAYERGEFAGEDWLRKIAFIASDDDSNWTVAEGTDDYVIDHYTTGRGYQGDFPSVGQLGGDRLYAITHKAATENVLAQIRAGRGIINYGGHGGSDQWVAPHLSIDDVKGLNLATSPWVVANACETADFRNGDSIGETWLRQKGGAVGYLGSMDPSYWDEDDIFERRMYDGIFQNGLSTVADIVAFAQQEVWRFYGGEGKSRYYFETYTTLGDPSTTLRTWATRPVKILGPQRLPLGAKSASFQILDANNLPVLGARVALTSDSYEYRVVAHTTGNDGRVTLPLGRGSRFTVTASGTNLRLASQALLVGR